MMQTLSLFIINITIMGTMRRFVVVSGERTQSMQKTLPNAR